METSSSKYEMNKEDLIETFLMIIYRIIDYNSSLEQKTPSIFDKNNYQQEIDSDKLSTSSSSIDENSNFQTNLKEENYTLHDYFYYWIKKLEFNENLLILTMKNLDKLLAKDFILTDDNVKNILFTCMIITQKNFEDENFNDKDYAKILEVSTKDIINMQVVFLDYIDFSLYISDEEFNKYKRKMYKMWEKSLSFITFS